MKTTANKTIRELRKVIGRTQAEFAAMIGASKDTVASWETGRNQLSPAFARRIAFATGVDPRFLLSGTGVLVTGNPFEEPRGFTAQEFERYRCSDAGRTDEAGARQHLKNCVDALEVIFLAAARPGGVEDRHRLPGVLDSFIQWCERTREEFRLEPQIKEQLAKRKFKVAVTQTYHEWRAMHKQAPAEVSAVGFKDDKRKGATDTLRLKLEAVPCWAPGRSMNPPKPAIIEAVLPGKSEGG